MTTLSLATRTGEELRAYQADAGLVVDGVLGPMTRSALIADELAGHITEFVGFTGSFGLLIRCEWRDKGFPYVPPGEAAGVTIDFGYDLGRHTEAEVRRLYGHLWGALLLDELCGAVGLRGKAARAWLKARDRTRWLIPLPEAARILPRSAAPYWLAAVRACPALAKAPARVQTAMLSVTYSAWTDPIRDVRWQLEQGRWDAVAGVVRRAKGSKPRRELEASLIEGVM